MSVWKFKVSASAEWGEQAEADLQRIMLDAGWHSREDATIALLGTPAGWYNGVVYLDPEQTVCDPDRITIAGSLRPTPEYDLHENAWTFVMALLAWGLGNVYKAQSDMKDGFAISLSREDG